MKHAVYRIIYWLVGIILSIVILRVIAGRQICELFTRRGIVLYEDRKYDAARKYFRIAKIICSHSEVNNHYLAKNEEALGGGYSVESIRTLLASRDENTVIRGLGIARDGRFLELRREVEWLAEHGSERVSIAADEVLQLFKQLATEMRCAACGARYTSGLPEDKMPWQCRECGKRMLYPADRFYLAKLYCKGCEKLFIVERYSARPLSSDPCPHCGGTNIALAYHCRACGHTWGGSGMVTSCPKCHSNQAGGMSVEPAEAERYRSPR